MSQGKLDDAKLIADELLEKFPEKIHVLDINGVVSLEIDGPDGNAEQFFRRVLKLDPENHSAHNNLGTVAWRRGDLTQAKEYFSKSIKLAPGIRHLYINLANVLLEQDEPEAALEVLQKCSKRIPRSRNIWLKISEVLQVLGRHEDAIKIYDDLVHKIPDHAATRFNRGLLRLKLGDYIGGWNDFEWRFGLGKMAYPQIAGWNKLEWTGESINGKTLLVSQEQGYGDAIQMVRYIPLVKEMGARVVMHCDASLQPLFKSIPAIYKIILRNKTHNNFVDEYDLYVPMMSLPKVFATTRDSIPVLDAYIQAQPERVRFWKGRINQRKYNVGLVWSGNPNQITNSRRSCAIGDFLPLADVPGVQFYSLQKNHPVENLRSTPFENKFIDYMSEINDFAETAALVKCLDLVISVDTAVAHLAGAMGHPVWTVLWQNHCWRYSLDQSHSPWYPTMKLFRQTALGDWESVIGQLVEMLRLEVARNS